MPEAFQYHFEWDPTKAAENLRKHQISFNLAATVFKDPLALTMADDEHGADEVRWITLGQAENGKLLVVVHTYRELDDNAASVRIISGRSATRHEQRQYEEN